MIKTVRAFKIIVFSVFYLCFIGILGAQDKSEIDKNLGVGKMKARAKHAIESGDFYTALFYYEEIVLKDSTDIDSYFELAELYQEARNYKKGAEAYKYVYDKQPTKYPFALFYQAQMQKMCGRYEEALENMKRFKKEAGINDKNFKALLNKEIAGCDSGIVYREFSDNIRVKNMGPTINHPHTEFSPFLLDSTTMLFGSLRMDTLKYYESKNEHYEKPPLRQVYLAEKNNGEWEEQGLFETINDPSMEMGNFVYAPISNRYYFTKCSKEVRQQVMCKIYFTEKINGEWSSPTMLPGPINIAGVTSTQPAIVVDTMVYAAVVPARKDQKKTTGGRPPSKGSKKPGAKTPIKPVVNKIEYLYFVSDRVGGKGGLDIWYTYFSLSKKNWVDPVNLSILNTTEMECTPYFHVPSQSLYFSSNGHVSAGGLDVYRSQKDSTKRYKKPQNMAFPINSPQDELGFMLGANGKSGMLVSNRPGGTPYFHETCCDDIYSFEILPYKPFKCTLDLSVLHHDTIPCKGKMLKIYAVDLKTNEEKYDTVRLSDCNYKLALNKNYKYSFTIDAEGFQKDTLNLETRDMATDEVVVKKVVLRPTEKVKLIEIKPVEGVAFTLSDIQYETNQTELNETAKAALNAVLIPFLKAHPNDKLQIGSHTDDQGSHKYNADLSQKRADKVVSYLVEQGIAKHRLEDKGYGESKPIAPNQNLDGSDNPMGRSFNRRTEFLLIKSE